jgi:tyrosine ammonia-lyase
MAAAVELGGTVTPGDIARIARGAPAMVHAGARARMAAAEETLAGLVTERRRIYGVTTGYGPLACNHIPPELSDRLQRNLVYHLASGVGAPLPHSHVRAILATRAATLARGHSGIGTAAFDLLLALLERDVVPVVPEMGTVGASGDLTPLAHVALVLMGEGEAVLGGRRMPGAAALAAAGLAPVAFRQKEALALVNGTAAMTGIAALNAVAARHLLDLAVRLGLAQAEILGGHAEAFDPRFGAVRPHPGQLWVHDRLRVLARGSRRLQPSVQPPPVLEQGGDVLHGRALPQDPYSTRCLPQLLGAVADQIDHHEGIVAVELNAATDNPLIFAEDGHVLHGGNFFGQHVAYASDSLALGTIGIALLAERSVARITDRKRNNGLPGFLTGGTEGLDSGLMGAQVTASALVAEMRSLATPASIQSIPTNADNQDVVTMGTIAARKAARLIELCAHVLAIHALAVTQGMELVGRAEGFAPASRRLAETVREISPSLAGDRPLAGEITALAAAIMEGGLQDGPRFEA